HAELHALVGAPDPALSSLDRRMPRPRTSMRTTSLVRILGFLAIGVAPMAVASPIIAAFAGVSASAGAGRQGVLPYEKIAKDYATSLGLDTSKPEEISFEDVLAKHFVPLHLGLFDVRFPAVDLEKRAEDFRGCAGAVLE